MDPVDKKSIESFFDIIRSEDDWISINDLYSEYELHCFAQNKELKLLNQEDFFKGLEVCVRENNLPYLLEQNMFKQGPHTILAIQFFYRYFRIAHERDHLQNAIPDINKNRSRSRI